MVVWFVIFLCCHFINFVYLIPLLRACVMCLDNPWEEVWVSPLDCLRYWKDEYDDMGIFLFFILGIMISCIIAMIPFAACILLTRWLVA